MSDKRFENFTNPLLRQNRQDIGCSTGLQRRGNAVLPELLLIAIMLR